MPHERVSSESRRGDLLECQSICGSTPSVGHPSRDAFGSLFIEFLELLIELVFPVVIVVVKLVVIFVVVVKFIVHSVVTAVIEVWFVDRVSAWAHGRVTKFHGARLSMLVTIRLLSELHRQYAARSHARTQMPGDIVSSGEALRQPDRAFHVAAIILEHGV